MQRLSMGQIVRRWREHRGWSQRELAVRCKCSQKYLSKLERDEFRDPSVRKIIAICSALGRHASDLFTACGYESLDVEPPEEWRKTAVQILMDMPMTRLEGLIDMARYALYREAVRYPEIVRTLGSDLAEELGYPPDPADRDGRL